MNKPDQPVLGVLLMLGFCVLAPMGDSIAKVLGEAISVLQIVMVRFGVQCLALLPLVLLTGLSLKLEQGLFKFVVLRTVLHIIGIGAMFTSLLYLPLADAVAIAFVMPFIMLLLGHFVLGEEVGWRRIVACLVGFVGTLLVIQPSFAEVGWPALLPLIVAVDFALFMLVTRRIAKSIDAVALQALSGMVAMPILLVVTLIVSPFELPGMEMTWPSQTHWVLLAVMGLTGTLAHLLMTWSLRFAPSTTLAPMQYLEIPIATAIGWLVFRDLPNGLAAIGIVITISAGLYAMHREYVTEKDRVPVQE